MAQVGILPLLSLGMTVLGGLQQAQGIKAAGKAQMQKAQYIADQNRVNAGQERASAQRGAIEDRRKGTFAQSRARALAAAGGGTVGDVSNIIGDLGAESEYSALTTLYQGEDSARQLESSGNLALYEGKSALAASKIDARSTLMSTTGKALSGFSEMGGGTLFNKYAPMQGYGPRGNFDNVLAGGSYR